MPRGPGGPLPFSRYDRRAYPTLPTHFVHPQTGAPVAVTNHIHALRDFFGAAQRAGLRTREMQERFVDDEWVRAQPRYQAHEGWPVTHLWGYEAA